MDIVLGEESDMKELIPKKAIFKQPDMKFMKYKPRKSRDLEKELSMSEMEFVTSVQVDEDNNSKMTSRSTMSQLSQASSITLVGSFDISGERIDISGVNPIENSLDLPGDAYDFSKVEVPKFINDENFEYLLSNITIAKLGEKSILICPEQNCRGSMQSKENTILICRKCGNTRDLLVEEYQKPEIELSESLENFGKNFQKPEFKVDFSVLDKFDNQPTFDEIFKKIKDLRSAVRTHEQGPFYEWMDEMKQKLKDLTKPVVNLSRLVKTKTNQEIIKFILFFSYRIDLNSDCGVYIGAYNPVIPTFNNLILNKYKNHMEDSPWILDERNALRNVFIFSHKKIVTFRISIEVKFDKNRNCIIDNIELIDRKSAGRK